MGQTFYWSLSRIF